MPDIGSDAIDRLGFGSAGWTIVNKNNPATIAGFVTQVEIHLHEAVTSIEIGIFTEGPANTLTTRSNAAFGAYGIGYHAIVTNLAVEIGDFIGLRTLGGTIHVSVDGVGYWWLNGDFIPCVAQGFSFQATRTMSIGGTITAPAVGIQNKSANMGAKMMAVGAL